MSKRKAVRADSSAASQPAAPGARQSRASRCRLTRLRSAADRASGSLVVARWLSEEVQLVPMFKEVLPLSQHACSFARRLFRNAREGVARGARPRELLKVRNILNNGSLFSASNGTTSRLLHQEEHSLAVLVLAGVDFLFVASKVSVVHESGVLAQVTHQRTSDNGFSEKDRKACSSSSSSSSSSTRSSSSSPSPSSSILSLFVAQAVMQPVCLCRLTLLVITFGVDADVIDIWLFTLLLWLLAGVIV